MLARDKMGKLGNNYCSRYGMLLPPCDHANAQAPARAVRSPERVAGCRRGGNRSLNPMPSKENLAREEETLNATWDFRAPASVNENFGAGPKLGMRFLGPKLGMRFLGLLRV
jgi:hypothetical protein